MAFRLMIFSTSYFLIAVVLLQAINATMITTTTTTSASATRTSFSIGNETDRLALLAFKSRITLDPQGALTTWNDSSHFCQWEGVTCGRRHQRVRVLSLNSRQLEGSLSPFIGNLSFLSLINLANNILQGEIPQEVGRLFRLRVLGLSNNSLSGEIPTNISSCSNLGSLRLEGNMLVGKIPPELASLSNLQLLVIDRNNITGSIPSFLGNLTSLTAISASLNLFEGDIPDALGKLKNLTFLGIGRNRLSGTVPPSIFNLSSLTTFALSDNQLHGSLPPDLFLRLPVLQSIQLGQNQFSGPLPNSFPNASQLDNFYMPINNFTGGISASFGGLQSLRVLSLWNNNLGSGGANDMNFLASLINCSNLQVLGLMSNQLGGILPDYIGNLSTQLQFLGLSDNLLSGVIPSSISYLQNLTHLDLSGNSFTGSIPSEIGYLPKLQRLLLYENRLSGEIPFSLGNLSSLSILYLAENSLHGAIPSSLGNLRRLLWLDLSRNNHSGIIPKQLFNISTLSISFNLAENHLVGSLDPLIGNLIYLTELIVSDNKLSGEIPSDLGHCLSLENLNMAGNFFQGPIPSSLKSLAGIQFLDLSRNNLSGEIPSYLGNFSLQSLNLSYNDFEGEVSTRGVFSNASAFSVAGNHRLCGGIVELKFPKCTFKVSKKHKMPRALVLIIPIASALLGLIIVSLVCHWFMKRREKQQMGASSIEPILKVSYNDLLKATDGFSSANLIGVGGFGSVYRGILGDTVVAVKVLDLQRRGASKSFTAECEALRNIRHRNLVKVLTSCSSVDFQGNEFKALVYEFMSNGNLDRWLHQTSETEKGQDDGLHDTYLLLEIINIAIDVASALDYIHCQCQNPIVHCDLKPSNILLDNDMTAHVGDFGLARFLPEHADVSQVSSLGIKGTIGYAAPEYGIGNEPSTYGDVYSYGVLLLEMVTGKRPTDSMFDGGLNLHDFVKMAIPDLLMEVLDPRLMSVTRVNVEGASSSTMSPTTPSNLTDDSRISNLTDDNRISNLTDDNRISSEECLRTLAKIGVACSVEAPLERMDVGKVANELLSLRDNLLRNGRRHRQTASMQV